MISVLRKVKRTISSSQKWLRYFLWKMGVQGRLNQKQLSSLKNKYKGSRCFIMANGPSLLKCDLSLLKNEITICSNAHYLVWDQLNFVPTFITVEDRLVAEDRAKELNSLSGITKVFPYDLSYVLKKDKDTIFINFLREYENIPQFTFDFFNKVYWGGTVSYLNMQLAYYLGFSEIYLIGFDHNYVVTEKINNYVITSDKDDVNHIHPDYFGKGYRWHDPNVARMESSYRQAFIDLTQKNIKIFNATKGGMLEVFPRIEYDELFKINLK